MFFPHILREFDRFKSYFVESLECHIAIRPLRIVVHRSHKQYGFVSGMDIPRKTKNFINQTSI